MLRYTLPILVGLTSLCGCDDDEDGNILMFPPPTLLLDAGPDGTPPDMDTRDAVVLPDRGVPMLRDAAPEEDDWRIKPPDEEDAAPPDPPDMAPDDPPRVRLQVHALDIWAQRLVDYDLVLLDGDGDRVGGAEAGVRLAPGDYTIRLAAPDHDRMEVLLTAPDSDDAEAVSIERSDAPEGVTVWRRGDRIDLYLGLRHQWFAASGRPARHGNRVDFLIDGEDAWQAIYDAIRAARESIHAATWWWQSDFELIRPAQHLDPEQRRPNTIMALLEASRARKRVTVYSQALFDFLNTDRPLEDHGAQNDDFEYMGQGNPTSGRFRWSIPDFEFGARVAAAEGLNPDALDLEDHVRSTIDARVVDLELTPLGFDPAIGSYHQKFFVIDGTHAFVGGMNVKSTDWDTAEHNVFEPRRMEFGSSAARRSEVAMREREPDLGPRKDFVVGVEGPSVQDVQHTFAVRWRLLLDQAAPNAEYSTDFEVDRDQPVYPDGVQAQLVNTMPEPFYEYSIYESHVNAIRNAERYILIEDQYWRAPFLTDHILARMAEEPDLQLIVVTKPVSEWTDPGCYWTHTVHQRLQSRFRDRYHSYRMRAFDYVETWGFDETESRFKDMDIHSKLMIVDDVFLSVGSCNKNSRGYSYEGEMNMNVVDPAWVTDARQRVVANYLGVSVANLPADWLGAMETQALTNDVVWQNWEDEGHDISLDGAPLPRAYSPSGFMYPLEFATPEDCLIEAIGPDIAHPVR